MDKVNLSAKKKKASISFYRYNGGLTIEVEVPSLASNLIAHDTLDVKFNKKYDLATLVQKLQTLAKRIENEWRRIFTRDKLKEIYGINKEE